MSGRSEFLNEFRRDLVQGLREGPLVFFAPIIAICRLIKETTDDLLREQEEKRQARLAQKWARL